MVNRVVTYLYLCVETLVERPEWGRRMRQNLGSVFRFPQSFRFKSKTDTSTRTRVNTLCLSLRIKTGNRPGLVTVTVVTWHKP